MDDTLLWIVAIALIVIGVAGTFLPAVPGVVAVFGGMLLAAWIDGFQRVGWPTLAVLGVLTLLAFAADLAGTLLGAKRVGASRQAMIGAAIGGVAGILMGFVGILVLPFVGAVAGELLARRHLGNATRVGIGTWIGLAFGALAKVALVFAMLAVFVTGYFVG